MSSFCQYKQNWPFISVFCVVFVFDSNACKFCSQMDSIKLDQFSLYDQKNIELIFQLLRFIISWTTKSDFTQVYYIIESGMKQKWSILGLWKLHFRVQRIETNKKDNLLKLHIDRGWLIRSSRENIPSNLSRNLPVLPIVLFAACVFFVCVWQILSQSENCMCFYQLLFRIFTRKMCHPFEFKKWYLPMQFVAARQIERKEPKSHVFDTNKPNKINLKWE